MKHSQPVLTKCLQAALIAAPVLLAAAPSEAGITTTIDGFTGEFAPAEWSKNPTGAGTQGNSVAITGSSITLRKNLANLPNTVEAFFTLSSTFFDEIRPEFANGRLLKWSATGLYDFSKTGSAAFNRYTLTAGRNQGTPPFPVLNTSTTKTNEDWAIGEDYTNTTFVSSELRFALSKSGTSAATGVGTGVIKDFQFTAEYDVPGPLPIVGAAAAFAWSRRLRKRLNSAKSFA